MFGKFGILKRKRSAKTAQFSDFLTGAGLKKVELTGATELTELSGPGFLLWYK